MLKKVCEYIKNNTMLDRQQTIVLGVSGGADSMSLLSVLLELRKEYELNIVVVHINHGLRGEEANQDMDYVESFCRDRNIEFRKNIYDIGRIAKENHISTEEAGRMKRYEAFYTVLHEYEEISGIKGKIAVAHNMDDSSETVLFNLFRGTGLKGLTGIPPARDSIIRPLLCVSRKEIEEYLKASGIEYRTDKTNFEDEYTRNKIRLNLLPYIEENINTCAKEHIQNTANMLSEIDGYLEEQGRAAYEETTRKSKDESITINQIQYIEYHKVIRRIILRNAIYDIAGKLKDITLTHIEDVMELMNRQVGKSINLPYNIKAVRTYEGITIKKITNPKVENDVNGVFIDIGEALEDVMNEGVLEKEISITLDEKMVIKKSSLEQADFTENLYTKWLDYDILSGSLSIRSRKQGDYMIIDSFGNRKKIKDILINLKVPSEQRDSILMLAKESEVFWIIGYRISESCKVRKQTKNIIKMEYISSN